MLKEFLKNRSKNVWVINITLHCTLTNKHIKCLKVVRVRYFFHEHRGSYKVWLGELMHSVPCGADVLEDRSHDVCQVHTAANPTLSIIKVYFKVTIFGTFYRTVVVF